LTRQEEKRFKQESDKHIYAVVDGRILFEPEWD